MEETLSRRERKKQETRQALLEAALALFREKGYDETTVEEITERSDVSKGTFFNYFDSKQALLGELVAWQMTRLQGAVEVAHGAPQSPLARIELLMTLLREQTISDWRLFQRAYASRLGRPSPHQGRHRLFALVSDLVREAQASDEIRDDVEAELVSDLIFVAYIRRLAAFIHKGEGPPPVDDSEQVMDILMNGLAGPNWRRT